MIRARLAILLVGSAAVLSAQSHVPQALPAFEVASIKPRVGEIALPGRTSPDRFYRPDTTIITLINYAFDMREYQIDGGPDWIRSDRFDVNAKASSIPEPGQMRLLVRRLLEERFALKTHVETRELPIYELVVARDDGPLGPNIERAAIDCTPFLTGQRPREESPIDPDTGRPRCFVGMSMSLSRRLVTPQLKGVPLSNLTSTLEPVVGRRIVDKTGLDGVFDMELTYRDERFGAIPGLAPAQTEQGPALFTALEEQLGLKLESARGPVDVLVIDSVERPTPD